MDLALRKTYRAQLTKMVNSVRGVLTDETVTLDDIAVLSERIKAMHLSLKELNDKLAPTFKEDQLESECEKYVDYEAAATEAVARLERKLTTEERIQMELQQNMNEAGNTNNVSAGESQGNLQNNMQQSQVRLPKLDIIKFNGDIALWPEFWEQYSVAIHGNKLLNDSAKFAYLKSYLTGKAAVTISGLTSSKNSYNDAIELLKSEYACTDRIIDTYIQQLLAIPYVKHEKETFALRKLYNIASTITKSLTTLGISAEQYGLLVKSILFKALPYNMRIAYSKQKLNSDYNDNASSVSAVSDESDGAGDKNYEKQINGLLNFIKVELDSIEQARILSDKANNDKDHFGNSKNMERTGDRGWNKKYGNPDSFTAASLLTGAGAKEFCLFCKSKSHLTTNCDSSLSIAAKKDTLRQNRLCFRCIKPNHNSRFCRTRDINCAKCKMRHATTMCEPRSDFQPKSGKDSSQENAISLISNSISSNIYLKTACAFILPNNNCKEVLLRMIIDGGSQLSFIKEDLSRQMNLPVVGKHKIAIQSFGQSESAPARLCNLVKLRLQSQFADDVIELSAVEVPEICFDTLKPPSKSDPIINEFSLSNYLADFVKGPRQPTNGISLLIGADNYWRVVSQETVKLTNNLTAIKTMFGWTIHGSSSDNDNEKDNYLVNFNATMALHAQVTCPDENELQLKKFWDLETIGISASDNTISDNFTNDFIKNNVTFDNERYLVTLPWQSDKVLDSNFSGALVRVKRLVRKLCQNGTLAEYDREIREYSRSGCAEEVPINEYNNINERAYYMPHRPVYRDDKETTKLRVVFDASAHAPNNPSLNDKLSPGENLVSDLLRILISFRVGAVALIADIEKAFLQIGLDNADRDYHRFLWFKEPINDNVTSVSELPNFTAFRMKRVTFGVTTSPFLLAVTLKKHLMKFPEHQIGATLLKSFYVDDLVLAVGSTSEAIDLYKRAKMILFEANMNLRKWCSNDQTLMQRFNEDEQKMPNENKKKVLGIVWYPVTDEIAVDLKAIVSDCSNILTKRHVLQTIAKIFDPLGILGPVTVTAKLILQDIWRRKLDWDDPLPEDLCKQWTKWRSELLKFTEYSINRSIIGQPKHEEVELHIFADASPHAYGCVAYIRNLATKESKFIVSKNRVAPLNENDDKALTLPKLELTAALCASRLGKYLLENICLRINKVILWSDSRITLCWIRGNAKRWKPYVKNRVDEIQKINIGVWKYCPGKCNPADLVTRGVPSASCLTDSRTWLEGPSWLQEESDKWPEDDVITEKEVSINVLVSFAEVTETLSENKFVPIFSLEKFSSLEKMLRITAYVKRFLNNVDKRKNKVCGPLLSSEINQAEIYWINLVQHEAFPKEIYELKNKKIVGSHSPILTLKPFLNEDNVLRLGGRLQEACLSEDEIHPVILPKKSLLTSKIIWRAHELTMHSGVAATLAQTRKRFWVIQGRQQVKAIISKCVKCKKLKGKSGDAPFAPLPRDRVTLACPFDVTGVDFAGPLYVASESGQRVKTYLMLLTCASIRAVHLELVPDLTSESCIRGLRRFISRRGVPKIIYSDNAKTFKRASQELHELSTILMSTEVQDVAHKQRIEWKFIVERATWWGGFWERLVRTVKNALKISLGDNELQTILSEVEMVVNSRPLTYVDNDPGNLVILSPAKFLIGPKNVGLSFDNKLPEIKRNYILKQWELRHRLATQFWRRWTQDYLQQLRSAHHMKNSRSTRFEVGDIVLLSEQYRPRLSWKLARVTTCFQGRDGQTRACEIETSDGTRIRRPIQLLYPLEIEHVSRGEDVENTAEIVN